MATPKSAPPLSAFTEAPTLKALKGGRIGLSIKGKEPVDLATALKSISTLLDKATTADERNRLTSIQKILTALSEKAEKPLRQVPPTEKRLATLAQAATLKREKRIVEDAKRPSGHFTKRMSAEDMTPADAAAAREQRNMQRAMEEKYGKMRGRTVLDLPTPGRTVLSEKEVAALREGARRVLGPRPRGSRRRLTGGTQVEGGPVITARGLASEGMQAPEVANQRRTLPERPEETKRRAMTQERMYRESLGGSMDRPSAIEDLQPERFTELRKEGTKIVEQAGDKLASATARQIRKYNAKVNKAVKAGEISKDLGNTLRNRVIENIMTSGSGDAVLGALSGLGSKIRYQTKSGAVRTAPSNAPRST